jgi:hypothetical protein
LAALQVAELGRCTTYDEAVVALRTLPQTLPDYYNTVLDRIHPDHQAQVAYLVQWIAFAVRPITLPEIVNALEFTVNLADDAPFPRERTQSSALETMSESLVAITLDGDGIQTVTLAHPSVLEHIKRLPAHSWCAISQTLADNLIYRTCVSCITAASAAPEEEKGLPLMQYAAQQWYVHAQRYFESQDPDLGNSNEAVRRLWPMFNVEAPMYRYWSRVQGHSVYATVHQIRNVGDFFACAEV